MPAICRSFNEPLESIIYLDATFAIAGLESTEPYHAECMAFRERMEKESVLCVVSDFVYNELAFQRIKIPLMAEARRTGRSWLEVKRNQPHLIALAMLDVDAKMSELNQFALKLSIVDTVTANAFQLMRDYNLLPTDAYHIATALESGVNTFATLDSDFLLVDDIICYTCLPH